MRCAAAFVCLPVVVCAQTIQISPGVLAERQTVSQLLASNDPAKLAWGAHLAGNYQLPEFAPDLQRLAVVEDWRVRSAAVDSMIRLNLDVADSMLTQIAQ